MRKIAKVFSPAVATVLLVALLAGFPAPQALAASAFAPDCQTNQLTGQTDCGGSDFFAVLRIAIIIFVVIVIIAVATNLRSK